MTDYFYSEVQNVSEKYFLKLSGMINDSSRNDEGILTKALGMMGGGGENGRFLL